MSISEKSKAIHQSKAQYSLDWQTPEISALSSGNVSKCEFLTGKDFLLEKRLAKKAAALKRFEAKELKAQTDIAKKLFKK